jgi:hypothetical protein
MPDDQFTRDQRPSTRRSSDPAPEADALEQAQDPQSGADADVSPEAVDASDADALEQARPASPNEDDAPTDRDDVPEADALEQSRVVPVDDDEHR